MKNSIKTIAFDADDTLWVNEPYFQEAEKEFCNLLEDYVPHELASKELLQTEIKNLNLYGYGVKGFVLCMIEAANQITANKAPLHLSNRIIAIGQELLQKPVILLDEVEHTLAQLKGKYQLIVATKGDLLDQKRKLIKSGLENYFHHIEIMSDKQTQDYTNLLQRISCAPQNFLMLGNSLKSDILPVLELGGFAGHIPYHVTWTHELHDERLQHIQFIELDKIGSILNHL
ncbi:HAD family hydrolase [Sphingobacterium yanglingense]|uniref:Putative hydrolase of the HAD superfamily n=1 Tax=Sphingobacterium yanglingense TaxID=1437280 RepID=A0A4R6WHA9_9SPHI|nr:HAD family hydrolase [Sphingobacterium yanglingense]TDQ79514.1 putative hydrolase of the HAD superfamily [Sphingobacterium yanglingense]